MQDNNAAWPGDANERDDAVRTELPRDQSAMVAHELANLLDGCLRNIGLVITQMRPSSEGLDPQSAEPGSDEVLSKLQTADHAMRQMARLVHRWLRCPNPLLDLKQHTWLLGEAVKHATSLLGPAAQQRGIDVVTELDPAAENLDAGPVYPVIMNALRNSIEAIDADRTRNPESTRRHRIELGAEMDQGTVRLRVADTGVGIDAGLMDEHGRVRFGTTTKPDGHGLGLTLSRQIAQSIGGDINLTPRCPCGAVLELRYPVGRSETDVFQPGPAAEQRH